MADLIVAFPNRDNATNIRNILSRGGFQVNAICTTGAQVLHSTELLDEGIIICGYKLPDMLYSEIRDYLPPQFEMLLVASADKWDQSNIEGVVGLPMPIKVYDLINTVGMMSERIDGRRRRRRKERMHRNPEQQKLLDDAKLLLMNRNHMTEAEAHRYLQKCSMESGTNMLETAAMVLSVMSES